jgi:uncharacterized protein YdhG (YjbR/CyaY superfamily)
MKERAKELKSSERGAQKKADDAEAALAKIAEMSQPDRNLAERIHAIISAAAPDLLPKTWYGMPAYAKDGKIICFFKPAEKFGARYATLGFSDAAKLDDGTIWPTEFAVTDMTTADQKRIAALIKQAAS